MKKTFLLLNIITLPLIFNSCSSTKVQQTQIQAQPPVQEIPSPEEPKTETPKKIEIPKDEYSKSVGQISVSKDTFENDKAEIMNIIDKLSTIMKDFDYESWLLYVDDESKSYWSKPSNLKKAQSRLPIKGLQIRNLQDYFKYVFIPARSGREVSSIRYVTETYVKAVQVVEPMTETSSERTIVYYYFNKIDGHWELHLPEIED